MKKKPFAREAEDEKREDREGSEGEGKNKKCLQGKGIFLTYWWVKYMVRVRVVTWQVPTESW